MTDNRRTFTPRTLWAFCVVSFLATGCAAVPVPVEASAAQEADGIRVQFRRLQGHSSANLASLTADGGRLEQVVHSPDGLTASALWKDPSGTVSVRFPFGGEARVSADALSESRSRYIFYEGEGATVSATVPQACPVRPAMDLTIELADETLRAQLVFPDGRSREISKRKMVISFDFPTRKGRLMAGDLMLELRLFDGNRNRFLVGIDSDGTPAAVSGYVQPLDRWVESDADGKR
jgi:hypothetical protein